LSTAVAAPPLYHPAWHVPFQLGLMAKGYLLRESMVVADMGLGKTHVAMGLGAYCLMAGDADLLLIICEKGKLLDWRDELAVHASMGPPVMYYGPDRARRLARGGRVLITTYETARQDLAVFVKKGSRKAADGPLLAWLLGRRPVVVYDEGSAKLGNRSSALYKAHAHMLRELRRRNPRMPVCVLTGTPIERDWENAYNTLRLAAPGRMPLVRDFEAYYSYGRDDYGRLRFRRDRMGEFAEICRPVILRKRKTDADVIDEFPVKTERFERIDMGDTLQAKLYKTVEDLAWGPGGERRDVPGLHVALRQLAGHPRAIIKAAEAGGSRLAALLAGELRARLTASPSAKTEMLITYARQILDEDGKLLVFTFFGQSVLPVLAEQLGREGFPLFVTHGQMSISAQHEQRTRFRTSAGGAVLLSSDAGARGLNIPEATTVVEYESAVTNATRQQRFDRAHRLGHGGVPLLCVTFVLEGTAEVPLLRQALERNEQQDILLGDDSDEALADGYVTAGDRRMMFAVARKRRLS
jgi:SNF2 family DNA or RNA helicase